MNSPDPLLDDLDRALAESGPSAALDRLVAAMEARDDPRGLLDALLLQARHDLSLSSVLAGSLADLAEPARSKYEERYVEAIRRVGSRMLAKGDIVGAWPYFRAIGEKEAVAAALETFSPGEGDSSVGHVVEVAFTQGVHPRRGFELILEHFGICSAITSFESLPPDEVVRIACAQKLTERLHEHLVLSLRDEIERRGQPMPPQGTSIPDLIAGRDWLFFDDAYHLDVSHLAAVVRVAPILEDREALAKAVELTDYGAKLSDRHKYAGDPPFERVYEDHGLYLRALLGLGEEEAIGHIRDSIPPLDPDGGGDTSAAQILIRLLVRLNRLDQAIDISAEHLAGVPEGMLMVPGLSQLCQRAGRLEKLAEVARAQADPVRYASAILPRGH